MEIENDKNKQMVIDILQGIIDDMGGMAAKKLMPDMEAPAPDDMSVEIKAKKLGEGTPEEEAAESPMAEKLEKMAGMKDGDEPEEDMSSLPRWKQRMKKGF